jgi:hypothetical protein
MELKLENLITNLVSITQVQSLDSNNAIVVRLSNTVVAEITVIACSNKEPLNMVLPLNVAWLNLNPNDVNYMNVLVRASKTPNKGYVNTWTVALYYADVMVAQYYDATDTAYLGAKATIGPASTTILGIMTLSVAASDPTAPIVVGEGDPRLTDARMPPVSYIPPILPARQLQTATSIVTIDTSVAPIAGQVLLATSPTTAVWTTLVAADIH